MHVAPTQETGTTFNHINYPKSLKINKCSYMVSYYSSFHNEVAYDSVMHIYIYHISIGNEYTNIFNGFQGTIKNSYIYSRIHTSYNHATHSKHSFYLTDFCSILTIGEKVIELHLLTLSTTYVCLCVLTSIHLHVSQQESSPKYSDH